MQLPALFKTSIPEGKNAKQDDYFGIETNTAAVSVVTVCSFP